MQIQNQNTLHIFKYNEVEKEKDILNVYIAQLKENLTTAEGEKESLKKELLLLTSSGKREVKIT